ncbi:MAG: ATP-binding protein [Candidatus Melainabacteria bacterium]|nr:ATP-binding protein [Candidatus Melainabacteria bacterium]
MNSQLNELTKASIDKNYLLQSVLTSIFDGVVIADANGQIILVNPAAVAITGRVKPDDLPMEQWSAFFGCYREDGTTIYPWQELPLARAINGESVDQEEMILKNEGLLQPRWISVSGGPILNEAGTADGAVVLLRDVTERKRSDKELRRSNEELQNFAFVAAHDLQEPLRTVLGFLDLLSKKYGSGTTLDEKAERYINHSVEGGKRLQRLVGDLLIYSRLSTKPPSLVEVDCNSVVKGAIEDLRTPIYETEAKITIHNLPIVVAENVQLRQLFQNLIGNAIKYRSSEPLVIDISCERQGINWLFTVRDNGIGFEMEYAEKIFLIFQRLHGRTAYPGTGIGLALCRRIVERHQGRIWVTSEPNSGSSFKFTLPVIEISQGQQ